MLLENSSLFRNKKNFKNLYYYNFALFQIHKLQWNVLIQASIFSEFFVFQNRKCTSIALTIGSKPPIIIWTVTTTASKRDNTHQRTSPREQRFIPEMREFSSHFADRAVERGYYRLRLALTNSVDQRAEAPSFRLARHWKLINPNY